ncbi:O-antigen ligase family protein [Algibacter sp.]|uniref:O-antigen ligase family protein n=1 Tax=Algibacter sp. TaxID=1872428 RepID=UPI003C742326
MSDYKQYFNWSEGIQLQHFYVFFILAALASLYLVIKSKSRYKFEIFFLTFYLLTGNTNSLLTLKIPGFSLFEIQPERFLFFVFSYLILRKSLFAKTKFSIYINGKTPWFMVALFGFIISLIVSQIVNISHVGIGPVLKNILDALNFLVIIIAIQLMADKASYDLVGKTIIIGAIVSTIISLIQLTIDPYFLRIGDNRLAFGGVLRSNGIFSTEYFNSYYLIIAISWALITIKNNLLKIGLVCFFSLGVISSFQRMSWIILILVILTYLIYIKKMAIEKLLLAGLTSLAILLSLSIFYYQDIMNSSLVKERLSESVDGRKGYYSMVLDNIGKKPIFGYGDLKNEVYYINLLRITGDRDRATATTGDLHSGYFSSLFLYGIPACTFFILFVVLAVFYYSKSINENLYFVIPFLVAIIYMVGNLTNTFLFFKHITFLFAVHIGIGMGINKIKEQNSFNSL